MGIRRSLIICLVLIHVSGCGEPLLKTRGRVLRHGAPFLPGKEEFVRVIFVPVVEPDKQVKDYYVAQYNALEGTFQVAGKDLRGMPPGKYRVAIELDKHRRDLLRGAFDAENSPFVYDVDSSTGELVIDLDQPPARR